MLFLRLKLCFLLLACSLLTVKPVLALAPASFLEGADVKELTVLEQYPDIKKMTDKSLLSEIVSELLEDREKHLVLEKKEAKVKRIFMDWGGTLSDLEQEEMQALVKALKKRNYSLSILTKGAAPDLLCNSLKRNGVLEYFDQVIAVYGSTLRSETTEIFEDSSTEMVLCFPLNKISYLQKYVGADETVVLIDNEATNMSYNPNVIGVGVCGKTAKNIEGLVGPGTKWFHYALADLTRINALDKIFDTITPDEAPLEMEDVSDAVDASV